MPDGDNALTEPNRQKLDKIIEQMVSNNETDQNIQTVVNDFKSKYSIVKKKDGTDVVSTTSTTVSPTPSNPPSNGSNVKLDKEAEDTLLDTVLAKDASQFKKADKVPDIKFANVPTLTKEQKLDLRGKQIVNKQQRTRQSVDDYNKRFGTELNADEILNDADKTSTFLQDAGNKISGQLATENIEATRKEAESRSEYPNANYDFGINDHSDKFKFDDNFIQNVQLLNDNIVDKTIDEQQRGGLTDKQVVNKLFRRLDPKKYNEYVENIESRIGEKFNDDTEGKLWQGATDDMDVLRTVKAPIEFALNEGKRRLAEDKLTMGTLTNDPKLIEDAKNLQSQVKADDEIYRDYPVLQKSLLASEISKELAAKKGQLEGTASSTVSDFIGKFGLEKFTVLGNILNTEDIASTDAFKKALSDPMNRDAALQILNEPSLLSDATFFGSVGANAFKPVKDLLYSAEDFLGVRDRADRQSDAIKQELFPEETPGLKDYVHGARTIVNTSALLAGYTGLAYVGGLAAEAIATSDIGIGAGLATRTTPLADAVQLTKAGSKVVDLTKSFFSFGLNSADANLADADKFLDNDVAKAAYATSGAIINTVGGELLHLPVLSKTPALQKPLLEMANRISDKAITEDLMKELLTKAKEPYLEAVKKYGINVAKNTAVMKYFEIANGLNKMVFGGETPQDVAEQATAGLVDTALGVTLLSALGIRASIEKGKNSTVKNTLYKLANNYDVTRDLIETNYKEGKYNVSEYNEKIKILNTAQSAKNQIDLIQQDRGQILDIPQKTVYVSNLTAEGVINENLKSPLLTDQQKADYETQLIQLQTQRENILKGLTFDDNLRPLTKIFDAEQQYKKAFEDFNNGVTESDTELLKAKDNLINAQDEYKRSKIPIDKTEAKETATTEIKDTQIIPTFEQIKINIPENELSATEGVVNKVNNAENINVDELKKGEDGLYSALEAHPEAAHLIEPLILKLQNYPDEFKTKTETRTVTEKVPVETAGTTKREIKAALEQSIGSEATVTRADGTTTAGKLNIVDGNYTVTPEQGEAHTIGETQITNRDLKLPSEERVAEPIEFDETGNVKSVTFETSQGDLVTITNPEKALDLAIQLRAETVGEIPESAFNTAYNEIQKEIKVEVPIKDNAEIPAEPTKITIDGNEKSNGENSQEGSQGNGKTERQESDQGGSKDQQGGLLTEATPSSTKDTGAEKVPVSSIEVGEEVTTKDGKKGEVAEIKDGQARVVVKGNDENGALPTKDLGWHDLNELNKGNKKDKEDVDATIKKTQDKNWSNFKIKIAKILEGDSDITAEQVINVLGEKSEQGKKIINEMFEKKRSEDANLLSKAKEFVNNLFSNLNKGKEISKVAINVAKSDLANVVDLIGDNFIIYDVLNNKKLEKFADKAIELFGDNYQDAIEHINNSGKLVSAKPILLAKIAVKLNEAGKGKEAAKVMEQLINEGNLTGRTLQSFRRVNEILNVRGTPEYKTEIAKKIIQKSKELADAKISEIEREVAEKLGNNEKEIEAYKKQIEEMRQKTHTSTLSRVKDKMNKLIDIICKTRR